jgi:hypothetical protein
VTVTFEAAVVDERRAAILGIVLGVSFYTCALTGFFSWGASSNQGWWPSGPVGLFRLTQGTHLISGVIAVPLLLAKLRTVAPKLVQRPFITSFGHLVERISLLPLVGGSIFMLFSGVTNVAYWYPQEFYGVDIGYFFPAAHGKMAIIVVGALFAHILAKISTTRRALRKDVVENESRDATVDRRRFLGGVAATTGLVGVTIAGATIYPLRGLSVLSARHPNAGPQGIPANRTSASIGVASRAESPDYRLLVEMADGTELASFSLSPTCSRWNCTNTRSRSPALRVGAPTHPGGAFACATCSPQRALTSRMKSTSFRSRKSRLPAGRQPNEMALEGGREMNAEVEKTTGDAELHQLDRHLVGGHLGERCGVRPHLGAPRQAHVAHSTLGRIDHASLAANLVE